MVLTETMSAKPDGEAVFRYRFVIPPESIDRNGHVNNVAYVGWMQDVAVRHSDANQGTELMHDSGRSWVVRTHRIDYLVPAVTGEEIEAWTWVASMGRVRSERQYRFVRVRDDRILVKGATDWVSVDAATGKPRPIPDAVRSRFPLAPEGFEPERAKRQD